MTEHALLADYDRVADALRGRAEAVRDHLERLLMAEPGLKLHSVTVRLKTRESLERKLARPDRTYARLWDVTDLIGVRIIAYFEDGVERVARRIEAALPVDFMHSIDKRRRRDAGGFGYSSLHYVCALDDGTAGLGRDARFEIQVRTVLEHAWAEIEHDLGYKTVDTVPATLRRRLNRLAGILELADQEFVAIRNGLEAYARELPARIVRAEEAVPLDRLSLATLLECEEAQALDAEVAHVLSKALGDEPFFPEYLLRMLAHTGIATVQEARAGLLRHRAEIAAMVRPYFAFAWATWRLSPEQMARLPRGYCLFFLAHARVIHASALGIDKVERLARLYRELDYPDDHAAAQRVASDLVAALSSPRAV
jgi:ppGpp synthetase/RelA/SpoT-type nucleotidyltranferase